MLETKSKKKTGVEVDSYGNFTNKNKSNNEDNDDEISIFNLSNKSNVSKNVEASTQENIANENIQKEVGKADEKKVDQNITSIGFVKSEKVTIRG